MNPEYDLFDRSQSQRSCFGFVWRDRSSFMRLVAIKTLPDGFSRQDMGFLVKIESLISWPYVMRTATLLRIDRDRL